MIGSLSHSLFECVQHFFDCCSDSPSFWYFFFFSLIIIWWFRCFAPITRNALIDFVLFFLISFSWIALFFFFLQFEAVCTSIRIVNSKVPTNDRVLLSARAMRACWLKRNSQWPHTRVRLRYVMLFVLFLFCAQIDRRENIDHCARN